MFGSVIRKFRACLERAMWTPAILVVALTIIVCADVLARAFRRPIGGIPELVSLGMVLLWMGIVASTWRNVHATADFLIVRLPDDIRQRWGKVAHSGNLFAAVLLCLCCIQEVVGGVEGSLAGTYYTISLRVVWWYLTICMSLFVILCVMRRH